MEVKNKIVAFDGEGFHNWKFRLETVLDMHNLLDCLERKVDDIDEYRDVAGETAEARGKEEEDFGAKSEKQKV